MFNFNTDDRVRCIVPIPASMNEESTVIGIPFGFEGTVLSYDGSDRYPIVVLWDKSVLSDKSYKCYVNEFEIEKVFP